MGGGGKIPYPKEVWSPAGGWYAQPGNWKANTAVMGLAIVGIVAATWSLSAEREHRDRMPEPGRFFPSRKSVTQLNLTAVAAFADSHFLQLEQADN
ncbi:conserved hypothetical protein [Talaromyces stipitatus ATCC 10500]|uniref:Uncharacterized protein n=1 Tax=Talaromyces stipitatus (strain ATCC 10500 / CBS 375.48 / QM 6759 / NRRL 1006) TaxID=441959 RepID=B8M2E5_TALSN|nr:uncharacterized protein TSTA_088450 [Talaromyces stipitatus ATCC 10500]EED21609.1 conserved hypothetical protein [Talaromyces stipitatus ATCC 10500]